MKKRFALIITLFAMVLNVTTTISECGDVAGYTIYSDIGAYINGYPIKSYNIEGKTAVLARDLESYGFDIKWNKNAKVTEIKRSSKNQIVPQQGVYVNARRAGRYETAYHQTDITAEMNKKEVLCYNIDGRTAVLFDDLSVFGNVEWNGEDRTISLTVSDLPITDKTKIEENPNVITMYASDGRTIAVGTDEIEAYKAVNWHENIEEVTKTLYSADGRTLTVFLDEVPVYLKLNWYLYKPGEKMVALTFDDGPSKYTTAILNQLEKYGAKATFFVVGNRVSNYADILRRESELGMEIGSHSWDHANLSKLSYSEILSQKTRTDDAVRGITGRNTTLVRPPYGSKNDTVKSVFNLPVVMWSVDTLDWKTRNAQKTINAVMNTVQDGDIVLMHDIYESSSDAAVELIPKLINAGYRLVTVSELGNARGGLKNGNVYTRIR